MALFGLKKEKKVAPKKEVAVKAEGSVSVGSTSHSHVILRPHITEKSGILSQGGVYTFQVRPGANKVMIASAVKSLYKVTPVKITVTNLPAKNIFIRGKKGTVTGIRKAIVTVKKGDKIDFV